MRKGTQSIQRSVLLLKAVAERRDIGWRLGDLAQYCGLEKTTAHRMLKCLVAERLLRQRSEDRRYIPGPLLFELATSLPAYMGFRDAVHADLESIARRLNSIAFLHLRAGNEAVCIDRAGNASVNPLTVIGTRRPLTLSTAGVAILLAMSRRERRDIMATIVVNANTDSLKRRVAVYRKIFRESEQLGYGISLGDVVPGLGALAVPLLNAAGQPFGAVSVMGPLAQYAEGRLEKLTTVLHRDAQRISQQRAKLISEMSPQLQAV